MSNPRNLFQHGWQFVVESFAGKPVACTAAPNLLQNLEDRLLYDASPLASLVSPPGESVEILDSLDQHLTDLTDFFAQENADSLSPTDHFVDSCFVLESCLIEPVNPVSQQVIFVDESVADFESLIQDVIGQGSASSSFQIVQLNQFEDGVEQIGQVLANGQRFSAVHIISHGSDGQLNLGNGILSGDNLLQYQTQLSAWSAGLTADADILLYGCEVAQTAVGESFVDRLSELTDADVGASSDLTGNVALGGDWTFEYTTGDMHSKVVFSLELQSGWQGVLDISTGLVGNWTFDSASGAQDSSGSAYHGSLSGDSATINSNGATNQIGDAKLDLGGSDDYSDLSAHASNIGALGQGTIAGWINTSDTTNPQSIFGVADLGDPFSFATLGTYQGRLMFDVAENGYILSVSSTAVVADGNWHHVAYTVDATGNRLYIDGVELTGASRTYSPGNQFSTTFFDDVLNVDSVHIGGVGESGLVAYDFTGLIDDVRLYDRALSSADISELFSYTGPVFNANLWLNTEDDVTGSGVTGLDSWSGGTILEVGDPNLGFSPVTSGTVTSTGFNLDNIVDDGDGRLSGIHYVGNDLLVGTNNVQLEAGDVLFSTVHDEWINGGAEQIWAHDILLFEPDVIGDYSSGTLSLLLEGSDVFSVFDINAFTLVETATTIGTTTPTNLSAGDFLISHVNATDTVYWYQPGTLGSTSSGTMTVLLDGSDFGIDPEIQGLDLVETNVSIGGSNLVSGQLLITLNADDVSIGGISTTRDDIFILDVTATGTTSAATAQTLFQGDDINLNTATWQEQVWGVSLVVDFSAVNQAPEIGGPNLPFINEIHYDNVSTDTGEAVEVAGVAGTDLTGWSLVFYNGATGLTYRTEALSGVLADQSNGFGTVVVNLPVNGIENGANDAIALVDDLGQVIEFLSYEGTMLSADGPATGLTSTDIGVAESGTTPVGYSLQRTGAGPNYTWSTEAVATFGSVNTGQVFSGLLAPETVAEENAIVFSSSNGNAITISDADADAGAADPILVTLGVSNGVLNLGSTTGLINLTGNGSANVSFEGSVAEINAALEGLTYLGNLDFTGADSLKIDVDDQGNTGLGGALTDSAVIGITVTPVNDAPVLDTSGTMTFTTISEDDAGNAGNTVAEIIASAGGDRVTDVDGDPEGIAVVVAGESASGVWEYSINGGTTWNAVGSVATNNALLLRDIDLLRFDPDGTTGGMAFVSFYAWDQSAGLFGSKVDATITGGSTAFSTAWINALTTVDDVNDAPIANIVPSGFGVNEDDGFRTLPGFSISDVDAGGADIEFTLSVSQGTINLSNTTGLTLTAGANGSATMTFTGTVSDINNALGAVAYRPDANFNGTDTITLSVDDQGNTGGAAQSDSDSANIVVSARNDAPTISDGFVVGLPGADEESTTAGATVSAILGVVSWSDVDAGAVQGLAITGATGNGLWEYSTDGITWNSFGSVTAINALLLDATSQVRYTGDGLNGEVPTFVFRAWDTTAGSASTNAIPSYADPGSGGGTSAYSSETATAQATITDLNDAPVLDTAGSPQLANVLQNTTDPNGDLVSAIIASAGGDPVTDVDNGSVEGIAVTAVDNANGTWEYSTDGGTNWTAFGVGINDGNAVVLTGTSNDRIRFLPDIGYSGIATFAYRAWDATDGNSSGSTAVDTTINGTTTAFSTTIENSGVYVEPVEVRLWLSTAGDIGPAYSLPASGVAGLDSWSDGSIVGMGDPNLSFGANTTNGTFLNVGGFDGWAADGDAELNAIHYVTTDITVTGPTITGGSIDLLAGDFLFVTSDAETLTTTATGPPAGWFNSLATTDGDIYVFRPENSGDYSSGFFRHVHATAAGITQSVTLVEQATMIGDTMIDAGDFIFSRGGAGAMNDIYWYDTSASTTVVLVEGDDVGIANTTGIAGIELIEAGSVIGGVPLNTGDLLLSLSASDADVGTNNLSVEPHDIFALNLTATTYGSGSAVATAALLFDGDGNANFEHANEQVDAFSLILTGTGTNVAPTLTNSGAPVNFIENGPQVVIDGTITVTDPDSGDFDTGVLNVSITAGLSTGDRISIFNQGVDVGQIGVVGNDVTYNFGSGAIIIGSFSGGAETPLVVNLNASADAVAVQALMRNITFWNTSDAPITASRDIDFVLTDGDGGTSNTISQMAAVTAVADSPVAVDDTFGLDFDGIDDFVQIADSPSLTMTNTMTMEAWVNPDASANVTRMIINKEGEYEVALFADNQIYWAFDNLDPNWAWHGTGYTVANNVWTHIAVVYDNGTVSTYVNGALVDVYYGSGAIGDSHATLDELRIGGRSNNPTGQYFDGSIDDVRIWNTARSQAEIQTSMDVALAGNETGLAGYWNFNEGFGLAANDLTGNANHGVLTDEAATGNPNWSGYTTNQNSNLITSPTTGVVANDVDVDGDTLNVTAINGSSSNVNVFYNLPSGAILFMNVDGSFDYDPNGIFDYLAAGESTIDNFTYEVDDGNGGTDTANVYITITGINDAPTDITPDNFSVDENIDTSSGFSVGTLSNDDPDLSDTFSYSVVGGPDAGKFSIGGVSGDELILTDGILDFETQSTYSVTVRVADAVGNTYDETLTVNVNDLNETPTDIAPNSFAVDENIDTTSGFSLGTMTATDEDGGETFSYSIVGGADAASFSIGGAGSNELIISDGVLDFETQSSYSVTVRVTDSGGNTYDETLTVNVNDLNETPTDIAPNSFAIDENIDTSGGTSLGTLTATDEDGGETFSYSIVGGADAASFSISGAGSNELIISDGVLDFETQSSYAVTVRVTDSGGNNYDETLTVSVNDLNETPTDISPDSFGVNDGTDTTGGYSVGAMTTTDQDSGETFTYLIVGGVDALLFTIGGAGGDELLLDDGVLDYEVKTSYFVTVRVTDGGGNTFDESLTVNVNDVNEAPTGIAPNGFTVSENTDTTSGVSLGILTTTDPDTSETFTYSIIGGADAASFSIGGVGSDELVLSDGVLDFETQSSYSATVRVTDSGGNTYDETLTVNVNDLNESPTEIAPNSFAIDEDINTSGGVSLGTLTATDEDSGETFTYSIVGGADAGSFSIGGAGDELLISDGVLDFETQSSYSVIVRVTDSGGLTYDENVSVTVNDRNEAPTDISPSSFSINENTDTTIPISLGTLTAADPDSGETFSYSIVGGADAASFSIGGAGDELMISDGVLDFETKSSYSVTVRVTDSGGLIYDESLTVNVNDLNEAPTDVLPNGFSINENTDTTIPISLGTLTAADPDSGETFSYSIVGGADAGSFSIGGSGDELLISDGVLDFETKSSYDVIVRVTDSGGLTYDENLTVNVNDLNENPVVNNQVFAVNENSPNGTSVGFVLGSDVDAGDSVTYSIAGGSGSTAFVIDGATGEVTVADASQLDFDFTSAFTLTVEVTDIGGLTDSATITINLNDINDEQVLVTNLPLNVNEGTAGTIEASLLETTDQDHGPASLTYSVVSTPTNGILLLSGIPTITFTQDDIDAGRLTYLHDGSETSVDSFDFRVDDGLGAATPGTFLITINPVNDAPVANDDAITLNEGDTHIGPSSDLLGNDTDAEFDSLTATLVSGPSRGTLTLNPDGSFNYSHDGSESTTDSFRYRISDGALISNVATVYIDVVPINDAPAGVGDSYVTPAGMELREIIGVLANDSDAESNPINAILMTNPANGTVLLNGDGSFSYIPDEGFYGSDGFSYVPNDGSLSGNMTLVNVEVTAVPPPEIDPSDPTEPPLDPPADPPEESPVDSSEPDTVEEKSELNEEADPVTQLLVNAIPETVSTTGIGDLRQFETVEEIKEYIELLTDRQQAEAVLKMLVANSSQGVIQDQEDIRRLRLSSGIGVAFDANYLWNQLKGQEDERSNFSSLHASVGSITTVGALGYLFWSLRGGVLIAAALSQLPSWRMIDPLPVLESYALKNGETEEGGLEDFFA